MACIQPLTQLAAILKHFFEPKPFIERSQRESDLVEMKPQKMDKEPLLQINEGKLYFENLLIQSPLFITQNEYESACHLMTQFPQGTYFIKSNRKAHHFTIVYKGNHSKFHEVAKHHLHVTDRGYKLYQPGFRQLYFQSLESLVHSQEDFAFPFTILKMLFDKKILILGAPLEEAKQLLLNRECSYGIISHSRIGCLKMLSKAHSKDQFDTTTHLLIDLRAQPGKISLIEEEEKEAKDSIGKINKDNIALTIDEFLKLLS